MQPMQPAQAKLKWLLEQVHMVRSRSVKHTAFSIKPALVCRCLALVCRSNVGTTRRRTRGFIRSAMTTRPGRYVVFVLSFFCAALSDRGDFALQVTIDQLHQFLQQQYNLKKQATPPPPPPPPPPSPSSLAPQPPALLPRPHTQLPAVVASGRGSRQPRVKRGRDGAPLQGAGPS